jgi:hypothetical protein
MIRLILYHLYKQKISKTVKKIIIKIYSEKTSFSFCFERIIDFRENDLHLFIRIMKKILDSF